MNSISVVVITLNEARNLPRCLASVAGIADEIVVLDSFSTDETVAQAKAAGARMVQQSFAGYVAQKNDAVALASHPWVLSLDADEALSEELKTALLQFKNSTPQHNAYRFSRLTNYCGTWIKHCGWYPDKKVRLFRKDAGAWIGENLHEAWELTGTSGSYGTLNGDLLHYSYYTLSEHIRQFNTFTDIAARTAVANGKNCSILKVWLAPKWRFFQDYILKLGILDGYAGYLVCKFSAVAAQLKYAKIRQYARQSRNA
ncbi:MAG: glycosyltransferase family 2 protein [Sphingobacteriales bacterium]|nr:MAG: glycosyltransferase family 2 protein [Sphingobacteriales bacterium]